MKNVLLSASKVSLVSPTLIEKQAPSKAGEINPTSGSSTLPMSQQNLLQVKSLGSNIQEPTDFSKISTTGAGGSCDWGWAAAFMGKIWVCENQCRGSHGRAVVCSSEIGIDINLTWNSFGFYQYCCVSHQKIKQWKKHLSFCLITIPWKCSKNI